MLWSAGFKSVVCLFFLKKKKRAKTLDSSSKAIDHIFFFFSFLVLSCAVELAANMFPSC